MLHIASLVTIATLTTLAPGEELPPDPAPARALTSSPSARAASPRAAQPLRVGRPADSHPAPVFWWVSTRRCGQDFGDGICSCALTVCRGELCGAWQPSSEAELIQSLQPGVPVCVMVHGSLVDEQGSRVDSVGTYRWLRNASPGLPLHVIFFDWPSDKHLGLLAPIQFRMLGSQAARNGFPIARLVSQVPPESPVCLMGHSHGARAIVAATHLLHGGSVQGYRLGWTDHHHRIRLVLAAAALDHDWLNPGERYDRTLCRAECVVNLRNRTDYALVLYPLRKPFGVRALGQSGLTRFDGRRLGSRQCRVHNVDVSHLIGKGHIWPRYYCQPGIARCIAPTVYFSASSQ